MNSRILSTRGGIAVRIAVHYAVAAAALFATGTAMAAPSDSQGEARSQVVVTRDLDLNSPQDMRRLNRRIANAADDVCGYLPGLPLAAELQADRCRRLARASAAPRVAALREKARYAALALAQHAQG